MSCLFVVLLLLAACDRPIKPQPQPADMTAWFAERGIQLPEPPPRTAGKAAQDVRLIGDADGTGHVDYWDLNLLWQYLTGFRWVAQYYDFDLLDIDRSGEWDWNDLMILGTFLFGDASSLSDYRIGEPLVPPERPFNIELDFVRNHGFTSHQMELFEQSAEVWEKVIAADIEDWEFSVDSNDIDWWAGSVQESWFGRIQFDGVVDDLLVHVTSAHLEEDTYGTATIWWYRVSSGLPINGLIVMSRDGLAERSDEAMLSSMIHELGHTLGIGTSDAWEDRIINPSWNSRGVDTYFRGFWARAAFRSAGGTWYRPFGVPVENWAASGRDGHWRESILDSEIMTTFGEIGTREPVSLITIRALRDMGYEVDEDQAEPYRLPPRGSAKVVAGSRWRCGVGMR